MKTDILISELSQNIKAEKRVCTPYRTLLCGLLTIGIYLFIFYELIHFRDDITLKLRSIPYVLEVSFSALCIFFAILAASWQAFPDLSERKLVLWLPLIPLGGFLASIGLGYAVDPHGSPDIRTGITCAMHMCLIALLPTIVLYFVLARGVFLHTKRASLQVGLATAMTSYLVARLAEKTDDMTHLLVWHLLPLFVLMALMGGIHHWLIRKKRL